MFWPVNYSFYYNLQELQICRRYKMSIFSCLLVFPYLFLFCFYPTFDQDWDLIKILYSALMDGIARTFNASSALVAKALAIRDACLLLEIRGLSRLVICSDSIAVISLASSDLEPPWEIATLINDIHIMAKGINCSGFLVLGSLMRLLISLLRLLLRMLSLPIGFLPLWISLGVC